MSMFALPPISSRSPVAEHPLGGRIRRLYDTPLRDHHDPIRHMRGQRVSARLIGRAAFDARGKAMYTHGLKHR
jgi:hypothetical protein